MKTSKIEFTFAKSVEEMRAFPYQIGCKSHHSSSSSCSWFWFVKEKTVWWLKPQMNQTRDFFFTILPFASIKEEGCKQVEPASHVLMKIEFGLVRDYYF
ncbi:hypothetical protein HanRHA438_Chr05g0236221 [Helianthus annuus]|nr:hypothetical protein HanRHA438_Chr05g0236221 [Helianthus annuus]